MKCWHVDCYHGSDDSYYSYGVIRTAGSGGGWVGGVNDYVWTVITTDIY
jgi:hypothetical protein